jgi:hypothetical protein
MSGAAWSNVRRFMAGILADGHARALSSADERLQDPSVDIPPGTLNNILKQAGLK